jgi:hypothetical protein
MWHHNPGRVFQIVSWKVNFAMQITELLLSRSDIANISVAQRHVAPTDGDVLAQIDCFSLTANNVTYAAHGADMAYWGFFPAPDGFGIVPVWGFATITESRAEGVAAGQRLYGYWPMASHAVLRPGKINARGFADVAAHREKLPPVYNNYVAASAAWGSEAVQSLFRPLYTTSFVLDVMLADSPAETLVLTSASSKTALGLAQAAKGRQRVIGLTSAANVGFVAATGYYDAVFDYADAGGLASETGTAALIDFSGNGSVRLALHTALGERLIESHIVGDTHWAAPNSGALPGVKPQVFFAPSVIVDRIAQWGAAGFEMRLTAAWERFMASTGWLQIVSGSGSALVADHWRSLASGTIDPSQGLVMRV